MAFIASGRLSVTTAMPDSTLKSTAIITPCRTRPPHLARRMPSWIYPVLEPSHARRSRLFQRIDNDLAHFRRIDDIVDKTHGRRLVRAGVRLQALHDHSLVLLRVIGLGNGLSMHKLNGGLGPHDVEMRSRPRNNSIGIHAAPA